MQWYIHTKFHEILRENCFQRAICTSVKELQAFLALSYISMSVVVSVILSTLCSCLQRLFSFMSPYQSTANLDLPAASPKSYFTGLPLLIQPSELCIIHPQHVVDMKCRNAFGSIINNSCSEKSKTQNGRQDWNVKGKQLNQFSDPPSFNRLKGQFEGCFTTL